MRSYLAIVDVKIKPIVGDRLHPQLASSIAAVLFPCDTLRILGSVREHDTAPFPQRGPGAAVANCHAKEICVFVHVIPSPGFPDAPAPGRG